MKNITKTTLDTVLKEEQADRKKKIEEALWRIKSLKKSGGKEDNSSKKLTEGQQQKLPTKRQSKRRLGARTRLTKGTGNFEYEHAIVKDKKFKWYWGVHGAVLKKIYKPMDDTENEE
ncbi:hypothetical protein BpHYR1_041843 [Brachionus plicatilis]|uniref:Uncharacterized protein n=1 Tax=Brachionus plicatilis TaxID=10195 RepID=A0A3M7QAV5_BRAPC|nr:hypothetical protein BpHYR1_041843 [Brachionus plicatilis]